MIPKRRGKWESKGHGVLAQNRCWQYLGWTCWKRSESWMMSVKCVGPVMGDGAPPPQQSRALSKPSWAFLSVGNVAVRCLCCLTPRSWRTWQVRKGEQGLWHGVGLILSLLVQGKNSLHLASLDTFGSILRQVQVRANCYSQSRADGNYWNMIRTYKGRRAQYSGRKPLMFLNTPARQRDNICRPMIFP